jgi:hypothetical protein
MFEAAAVSERWSSEVIRANPWPSSAMIVPWKRQISYMPPMFFATLVGS